MALVLIVLLLIVAFFLYIAYNFIELFPILFVNIIILFVIILASVNQIRNREKLWAYVLATAISVFIVVTMEGLMAFFRRLLLIDVVTGLLLIFLLSEAFLWIQEKSRNLRSKQV